MVRISARARRTVALVAAAGVLVTGWACSVNPGGKANDKFDVWIKEHPLSGAKVVGTRVQNPLPFAGTFEVTTQMDAEPTQKSMHTVMKELCAFNKVADMDDIDYLVKAGIVTLTLDCKTRDSERLFSLWTTLHALPGINSVTIRQRGASAEGTDQGVLTHAGTVITALAVNSKPQLSVMVSSGGVTVDTSAGKSLKHELALLRPAYDAAYEAVDSGSSLSRINLKRPRVYVSEGHVQVISGLSVAKASELQTKLLDLDSGNVVVTVLPEKVNGPRNAEIGPHLRPALDKYAADSRVLRINVQRDYWLVTVDSVESARALLGEFGIDARLKELDHLTLELGSGRKRCQVKMEPRAGILAKPLRMLDLCALDGVTYVSEGTGLFNVSFDPVALDSVVKQLHAFPEGSKFAVRVFGEARSRQQRAVFTSADNPVFEKNGTDPELGKEIARKWRALGPVK